MYQLPLFVFDTLLSRFAFFFFFSSSSEKENYFLRLFLSAHLADHSWYSNAKLGTNTTKPLKLADILLRMHFLASYSLFRK